MTARQVGLEIIPVPVDGDGIDVAALARTQADAVLVTPAHQFPTGVVLTPERRRALLDWARATDGLVIEDDYDAEFRHDGPPVGALQGLAPDHVAYIGTASKALAPGLRLGWLALPQRLAARGRRHQVVARQRLAHPRPAGPRRPDPIRRVRPVAAP